MIKNAKILPQVFYGLHMAPGVAEYRDSGADPYRILVNENTIKQMDPTFVGRPVYVRHKEEVNLDNIQEEADGYVTDSFYNSVDGKHWVKFIVVSDKGHEAIKKGWRLSNAYIPKEFGPGGLWHGVEYAKEVKRGEYEHLAIVPDPRYDESVIMTPEQFKQYNEDKSVELKRLANSKGEKSVLNLFKRTKVENSADFDSMLVQLPLSKKELTLTQVVNELDKVINMHGYAADEHMVKVNDSEEMSVKDLRDCYNSMKKKNEESELDGGEKEAMGAEKSADKTENEEMKKEEPKEEKKSNSHFEKLKNAPFMVNDPVKVDLNKAARGKSRYGSEN